MDQSSSFEPLAARLALAAHQAHLQTHNGVRLAIKHGLKELADLNAEMVNARQGWYPLVPMYQHGLESDEGAFWAANYSPADNIVGVLAARHRRLRGSLRDAFNDATFWTGEPHAGAWCRPARTVTYDRPLMNEDADSIRGEIVIVGAAWVHPSLRQNELTEPTFGAVCAQALMEWPSIGYVVTVVKARTAMDFAFRRIGQSKCIGQLRFGDDRWGCDFGGENDFAVMVSSRQELMQGVNWRVGVSV